MANRVRLEQMAHRFVQANRRLIDARHLRCDPQQLAFAEHQRQSALWELGQAAIEMRDIEATNAAS